MAALTMLEKEISPVGWRDNLAAGLIMLIALASLYAPTSINGTIVFGLVPVYICGLSVLLVIYGLLKGVIRSNLYFGLILLGLLAFFTTLSPLPKFAFGAFFPYLGLCTVLMVDVQALQARHLKTVLLITSVPMLTLGWATVLGLENIVAIQESWFQMGREDMFESLVGWFAKPVSVFGTHSVAAFVYFAMCILLLRISKYGTSRSDQLLSWVLFLSFAGLIPMLLSTSAFALFGLLLLILLVKFLKRFSWQTNAILVFVAMLIGLYLLFSGHLGIDLLSEDAFEVLTSKGNGFAGRFAEGSRLEPTYNYLFRNYFQPVGMTYDEIVEFGDGFIAEYVLRTSPLGYALVLLMLVNFLKRKLFGRVQLLLFVLFFLISDLGYPLLTSYRVAFVLPLYMVLWSSVAPGATEISSKKVSTC